MDFDEFLDEVVSLARPLGYNYITVLKFAVDIRNHYENGLTPEEVVEIEF